MRQPTACEDVANADLLDATFALAGSCNGMLDIENLSSHRHASDVSVGRDVGLITCVCLV